jgi:hypothetical protein
LLPLQPGLGDHGGIISLAFGGRYPMLELLAKIIEPGQAGNCGNLDG